MFDELKVKRIQKLEDKLKQANLPENELIKKISELEDKIIDQKYTIKQLKKEA